MNPHNPGEGNNNNNIVKRNAWRSTRRDQESQDELRDRRARERAEAAAFGGAREGNATRDIGGIDTREPFVVNLTPLTNNPRRINLPSLHQVTPGGQPRDSNE